MSLVGEGWNPHILVNLPVTIVSGCVSRYADTWIATLAASGPAAGSGPPDRTYIFQHRMDELLVEKHTVSDGQAASPVKEGATYAQSLGCLLSCLADVCLSGQPCIKCHPEIPCCFVPLYWFSEKVDWTDLLDASRSLNKEHSVAL
jgi:hypothetical protein